MGNALHSGGYFSVFGIGAPGPKVPHTATYYDTTVPIYKKYVYQGVGWHSTGPVVDIDADHLQGVSIVATPPTAGKDLSFNGADWTGT